MFDRGIGPTHPFWHIHARMDIGVHGISIHYAYGVPPPNALHTLRIHQILLYIIILTVAAYVRIGVVIMVYRVLMSIIRGTITVVTTVALLPVHYTTRVAIAIPFIHDSRNVALQFVNYIISCHGKRFVSVAIDNRHSVSLM